MSYFNFNAEISIDGIETLLPVRLCGEGGAVDFDQELSDARIGGVFEPVSGTEIIDFEQKNVLLLTTEKGSLFARTYILEQVSRIRDGWMFEAAINQKSNY
jgi:hypothetical protein